MDGNKFKGIDMWLSERICRWTQGYVCGWTDSKKARLICEQTTGTYCTRTYTYMDKLKCGKE
jgi:hypothetical protein